MEPNDSEYERDDNRRRCQRPVRVRLVNTGADCNEGVPGW
jgi:hypothetical protein